MLLLIRNYNFDDVHNEGAARIAELAQKNGVSRFIHVSHLNADPNSKSRYYAVSERLMFSARLTKG